MDAVKKILDIMMQNDDQISIKMNEEDPKIIEQFEFEKENAGTGSKESVRISGRWYCYKDKRYVTDGDDNYGTSYYQFAESGGTGDEPISEYEHIGTFVRKGDVISKLTMIGWSSSLEIEDMEMYAIYKTPASSKGWIEGIDSDSEYKSIKILSGKFLDEGSGGNMMDFHKTEKKIGFEVPEDGFISLYMKPVGDLRANRYFRATHIWDIIKI